MTEQSKIGGEAEQQAGQSRAEVAEASDRQEQLAKLETSLNEHSFNQVKQMLEKAEAAQQERENPTTAWADLPDEARSSKALDAAEGRAVDLPPDAPERLRDAPEARIQEPQEDLTAAERADLGQTLDELHEVDPEAAKIAAAEAGRFTHDSEPVSMAQPELQTAYTAAQEDARQESTRTEPEQAAEQTAEQTAATSDKAKELTATEEADRKLTASDKAKEQFDRYDAGEIEYKDVQATDELAEGYEINRKVAYARMQQDRHEKGEVTADELAEDKDAEEGRTLDADLEAARAQRIEDDKERGEMEAVKKKEPEHDNQLEDYDVGANAQHRNQVPEDVERDFPSQQAGKARTHYYAKDVDKVAFVDKGDKMQTPRDFDQHGVRAMVNVAKARGWDDVKVKGSESFRRQVYLEAAKQGMEVKGYKPTDAEQAIAEKGKANHEKNHARADAFDKAQVPEARSAAAKEHGHELRKAYAMEASLRKWAEKRQLPQQSREKLEKNLHESLSKHLRDGHKLPNVQVRQRQRKQDLEAETEQAR